MNSGQLFGGIFVLCCCLHISMTQLQLFKTCSQSESNLLLQTCVMPFAWRHYGHVSILRNNAPRCKTDVLDCQAVQTLVQCINTKPSSVISSTCKEGVPNSFTHFLQRVRIPCTFDDILNACPKSGSLQTVAS